jgi:hypothetical protein
MRTTAFEAGYSQRARSGSAGSPLLLRLRVYLTRGRLDRRIAAGLPCGSTPALALRARQLSHPSTLRQIADQLRGIVGYVDRLGSRRTVSAVVVERAAVRSGRHAILGLAERLEGTAPTSPKGIALAQVLLTDGLSPMFNRYCERTVTEATWEVQDALGPVGVDPVAS